ncbi:nucleotidyltransferase family protein [Aliiglaciecola sp. NS0011-25]|uniref:nucleotidyltransferase family protein n=1 Tax=Aliiglaciecola sp. NS0011-25 TaxID=3127654 RepID=UPI003101E42F
MLDTKILFQLLLSPRLGLTLTLSQWQNVIFIFRESKLLASLYHVALRDGSFDQYPEFAKRHLGSAQVYAKRQAQQILFEAVEFRLQLEQVGITAVFLKGAGYTLRNSLNSHGRVCSDIDVLVNKKDLSAAEAHLKNNRWQSEVLSDYDEKYYRQWAHEVPPLIHINRATVVDMHHNLYPPISGRTTNIDQFISSRLKTASGCFVLEPATTVMHSIIHLFANEDSSSWIRDLFDITLLIKEYESDDFWTSLIDLSKQTDFEFEFVCCMHALKFYTDISVPEIANDYIARYKMTKIQVWLMNHAIIPAICPEHDLLLTAKIRWAKKLVYLRGHWIKMPFNVLIKHFAFKSFFAIRDQIMGKHHFDPKLPENPNW